MYVDVYKREKNGKIIHNYYFIYKLLHIVIYVINYSLIIHYSYSYL